MANFILDDFKRIFTGDNPLSKIIVANVIIFLITELFGRFIPIVNWFAIPGDATYFLLHIWSAVTYMFLHANFMHILFNMLWLYWIGKILLEYLGPRRFVAIYFLGGIAGGLLYSISFNLLAAVGSFPMGGLLLGASAAVMAIVAASATLLPDHRINLFLLGPVPLKYLAIGALILTSVLDFSVNMGGKLAHIGGAALGFFFVRNLQNGKDWSVPFYSFLFAVRNPFIKKKMRVVSNKKSNTGQRQETATPNPSASHLSDAEHQQKIDGILDKIGKSGYDSLTETEKEFLFKASGRK
ncbi:MAG: rhomboid family intramembrane serine protease [Salibacteraceae bacterium]|nr:rhomboid family intramembrane serine protease [Salibacteraceae bacterium]|tara:strand:- start:18222 stop:19112 length:891 start_codon:yes stop_codon:yes gene_type:complete